jgi:hypothetical protein
MRLTSLGTFASVVYFISIPGGSTMADRDALRGDAVCVLTSGGLDSGVLIAEIAKEFSQVHPVYIRCGLF